MSTTETVRAWANTNAGNASADAAISSSDSQAPDTIDNNIRSVMTAVHKQEDDTGGALAAGGTANALTVTTKQVLESGQLVAGCRILLRATADNTNATVTFAPDGLTAANIKRADGSALAVGSIKSGMYLDLVYNSGSSEWRCANIPPATSSGSFGGAQASFRVSKSGGQAVATSALTKITWDTEAFDTGSYFDAVTNNRWTPPAGTCLLSAAIGLVNVGVGDGTQIEIFKNGSLLVKVTPVSLTTSEYEAALVTVDQCNGTDYYEVYVDSNADASYNVMSTSWFSGTMV